jgi:hypothetical protein
LVQAVLAVLMVCKVQVEEIVVFQAIHQLAVAVVVLMEV